MPQYTYRDLPEFGLEFVTAENDQFAALVAEIRERVRENQGPILERLDALGPAPAGAILVNRSGKAIVALWYVWRYQMADGQVRVSRNSNFGSSVQMDVLSGRARVGNDVFNFILAGSKRLITEGGMFGDNSDVLPPAHRPRGGGVSFRGDGRLRERGWADQISAVELSLDSVFFEDGLCVGPDEDGLFESFREDLNAQVRIGREAARMLREGESVGQVFEMLRPFARRDRDPRHRERHRAPLVPMFANIAIDQLIHFSGPELLAWFERFEEPPRITLHRPESSDA